jgi:hypothetical protein
MSVNKQGMQRDTNYNVYLYNRYCYYLLIRKINSLNPFLTGGCKTENSKAW